MHICFITSEYPKAGFTHGGVGSFLKTLAPELVKNGVKVSIIDLNFTNNNENYIELGVNIYRLNSRIIKGFTWILNAIYINKKINEIHKLNPIDIIETNELGLAFIKKISKIKYVIRMHGGHHFFAKAENRATEWKKVWQEKKSFSKSDHVVAVSKFVADETKKLLSLKNEFIPVIYNPINTNNFYKSDFSKTIPFSIFFAGTIVEKKGIRQLIQALEFLVDEFPQIMLNIAGRDANIPGKKSPYRPILESFISDKIRSHINFLGVITNQEVAVQIEKANVCCYPSHMEAMPLAWLEVLAMQKIFIGSKIGPGFEAVDDQVTGLLVNPFDPQDIASKIKYVFLNPTKCDEMAVKAREKVIKQFDIKVLIDVNIAFYNSILN